MASIHDKFAERVARMGIDPRKVCLAVIGNNDNTDNKEQD